VFLTIVEVNSYCNFLTAAQSMLRRQLAWQPKELATWLFLPPLALRVGRLIERNQHFVITAGSP